jgi:hypothetical protein
MHKLILNFTPASPAELSPGESTQDWGRISLSVGSKAGEKIRGLLNIQWNLKELSAWLRTNKRVLLEEQPPFVEADSISIADAIARFYENVDVSADLKVDQMYQYRTTHGIRFGLSGTDAPDIYLGIFRGVHEISLSSVSERWRYEIELAGFFAQLDLS